jgi:hypothetical protein
MDAILTISEKQSQKFLLFGAKAQYSNNKGELANETPHSALWWSIPGIVAL